MFINDLMVHGMIPIVFPILFIVLLPCSDHHLSWIIDLAYSKVLTVRFPGTVEVLAESQTILVKFQQQSFSYYSYCHINSGGDVTPSVDVLLHEMKERPNYHSNDKKPYILYPREMVTVDSLTCIIFNDKKDHFPLVTVPVMYNMVGEPTSLHIRSFNSSADVIRVSVTTVIPSFVWCEAFSDLFYAPTAREVMNGKQYYSVSNVVAEVDSLIPGREYRVFCYAESVAHVTMKEQLASCSFTTKTKNAEYAFDSWNEENGLLQFSIKTNIQSPFTCSIMSGIIVYPVNRIGRVYSVAPRGACSVKCFVSFGDTVYSMNRNCTSVFASGSQSVPACASCPTCKPCSTCQPCPTCKPCSTCQPCPTCKPVPPCNPAPSNQSIPSNSTIPTKTISSILPFHEAASSFVYSLVFILVSAVSIVIIIMRKRRFHYARLSNSDVYDCFLSIR